jgi:hypothetical protein
MTDLELKGPDADSPARIYVDNALVNAHRKQPHLCIENSHTWLLLSVCLKNVADANFFQDFLVRDRLVASWSL